MAEAEASLVERLVSGLTEAIKSNNKPTTQRAIKLPKFYGRPTRAGDPTILEWIDEVDIYCQQCRIPQTEKAQVVYNHLGGLARDEVKCNPEVKGDYKALIKLLNRQFGADETVQSLQKSLYERHQLEDESLMDFSRSLMRLYDRIIEAGSDGEKEGLKGLKDKVLINQFVAGAKNQSMRLELRRLELVKPGQSFSEMRDAALDLFRDIDKQKVKRSQVRSVGVVPVEDAENCGRGASYCENDEQNNVVVDGVTARVHNGGQFQQLLQQQSEMLKCLRDQQEQMAKQQQQLTTLMDHVLKGSGARQRDAGQGGPRVICFECKRPGHIRANCRFRSGSQGVTSSSSTEGQGLRSGVAVPNDTSTIKPSVKCESSIAVGRVMEEVTEKASTVDGTHCGVLNEHPVNELLARLVRKSPEARVTLAGVPVTCILDTGAETSLMSSSFFTEYLSQGMEGPKPVGTYIRVYGVGHLELPVEGYVQVPLRVHDHTIMAHFLVVNDSAKCGIGGRKNPVLIGCNILELLKGLVVDPKMQDAEAWSITLQWYHYTKEPICRDKIGPTEASLRPVAVRTGRLPTTILPRQVRTVKGQIRAPVEVFKDKLVLVDSVMVGNCTKNIESKEGTLNFSSACRVYDSCGITDGRVVDVLVANLGSQALVIPAHTKLAHASEVSSEQIGLEEGISALQVSVTDMLFEDVDSETGFKSSSNSSQVGTEQHMSTKSGKHPLQEHYIFGDGTNYHLPQGLSFVNGTFDKSQRDQVVRLIQKHDKVFSRDEYDVGCCSKVPHKINTVDALPVSQPYRRIPQKDLQEVRELLQRLLDQGIIRRSASPYASPVVLVRKKDGTLRLCVDYRRLNAKTVRDSFPLPRIEESLEALSGAKYFSSLDLAHGYHQVTMDQGSIDKTAFRVPFGLFDFTRMPFGLINAPGTFQRVMEMCLGDLNLSELLIYLDDILVFSSTFEEHLKRLDTVFTRVGDFGLKLKGKKCKLLQSQVNYLGHVVNCQGISVDNDKIEKIQNWPVPQNAEQLRSFLGLAGYYRRFVRNFSRLAAPLHALVPPVQAKGKPKKGIPKFDWGTEAQEAFGELKRELTQTPVLAYPDFTRAFFLETDASLKGLGACLAQEDSEGKRHPIAYASRGLRGAEANYPDYSSFKLELLALKWAVVDKFRDHLLGVPFTILTDNNPLAHLKTAKLGACEMRWVAQLAPFNFDVKFRSGRSNQCADALSRYPSQSMEEVEVTMQDKVHSCSVPLRAVVTATNLEQSKGDSPPDTVAGPPGVFPSWSPKQLKSFQETDPVLGLVLELWDRRWAPGEATPDGYSDSPELKLWLGQWSRFVERDNVLCRRVMDPVLGELFQVLLPKNLQSQIIEGCHDGWGHQGVTRTCSLLRRRVYWPRMTAAVRRHIHRCKLCTIAKATQPQIRVPMRHLLAFRPLEVLAIDFVKVDRGRGGYEDVLIMTDVYTKFSQAVPCKDQTAVTVAKVLRDQWFTKFGIPTRLHSDQGRNFEGDIVRELCSLYGIKKSRTTPYHPEGNAQAERFNRTLFGLIKSLDERDRYKWPDLVSHLVFVYNATPHSATGVAPYTLMFGREPLIPLDQMLGRTDSDWGQEFVKEQSQLLNRAADIVKDRVAKRASRNKALYDSKGHLVRELLVPGSQVLMRRCAFGGRHKLQNKYERDPYIVVWVNQGGDVCRIRPVNGGQEKTVNRKYLLLDPLAEPESDSEGSDEDSLCDVVVSDAGGLPDQPPINYPRGVGSEKVGEPLRDNGSKDAFPRRSQRATKGLNRNPYRLPESVLH